jgi:hypothetical protein
MTLTQLAPPYPIFTDKNGDPLDAGYLYFGVANLNPETNPIQVYYDRGLTQPVAQPVRTSNGYIMRNGSPALIYADSQSFSVTVRNKNNELVIYSPTGYGVTPGVPFAVFENAARDVAALLADTQFTYSAGVPNTVQVTPGDILRTLAEGFAYEVAASAATDQHVTTAGGVKLYVQTGADGGFNAAAWGIVSSNVLDQTTVVQKVIDFISQSTERLGPLTFPVGVYRFNVIIRSDVWIKGASRRNTIFSPATNVAVFRVPTDSSTVRITFENAKIVGDLAMAAQDGISLSPSGATFVDTVTLRQFDIVECGRYGLRAVGTSTSGPFVQRLHLDDVLISFCGDEGLSLSGTVLEASCIGSSITQNGGTGSGTRNNAALTTQASTQSPSRITFIETIFNANQTRVAAGLDGAGLYSEGKQVVLIGCGFENARPLLNVATSRASTHVVQGCRFGSIYSANEHILVADVDGMFIDACSFVQNGGTLPYNIRAGNASTRIKNFEIRSTNQFSGYSTAPILQNNAVTMSGATATLVGVGVWALSSGTGAGANLDTVIAADGSQQFPIGFEVTIHAQAGATDPITVRSAVGNIVLQGGNYVLDDNIKSITLRYDEFRNRFIG